MNNRGVKLNKSNNLNNEEIQQSKLKNKSWKRAGKRATLSETDEKDEALINVISEKENRNDDRKQVKNK